MTISENEALASIRVLVSVARADGVVREDERKSLSAALESLRMPGDETLDSLLEQNVDLAGELRTIVSKEARAQVYRSAYFMAHSDGKCTKAEQAVLDEIERAMEITPEQKAALERLFVAPATTSGGILPVSIQPIEDPDLRAKEVQKHILRYCVLTAALGAFPIPGIAIATDLAVVALQVKLIVDVGAYWGHKVDREVAKKILYGVGLGTGARFAVNNLAKLIPGWGSAIGAATSFASTYALGTVIEKLFASGAPDEGAIANLKEDFKAAEKEGKSVYAEQKDAIDESARAHEKTLNALSKDLAAGRITQEEFDRKVASLTDRPPPAAQGSKTTG
jgi:uncharacterized protein (DUF697 family)/tellurite resistance protein